MTGCCLCRPSLVAVSLRPQDGYIGQAPVGLVEVKPIALEWRIASQTQGIEDQTGEHSTNTGGGGSERGLHKHSTNTGGWGSERGTQHKHRGLGIRQGIAQTQGIGDVRGGRTRGLKHRGLRGVQQPQPSGPPCRIGMHAPGPECGRSLFIALMLGMLAQCFQIQTPGP